jgi:hypothetical protein
LRKTGGFEGNVEEEADTEEVDPLYRALKFDSTAKELIIRSSRDRGDATELELTDR